ncbi:MAG: hypothetical protein ACK475_02400, partial [Bacteroidota bacterium]
MMRHLTISLLCLLALLSAQTSYAQTQNGLTPTRVRGITIVAPSLKDSVNTRNQGVTLFSSIGMTGGGYDLTFPSLRGTQGQVLGLLNGTSGSLTWITPLTAETGWMVSGNNIPASAGDLNQAPTGQFFGTLASSPAKDLRIATNSVTRLIISSSGAISMAGATSINDNINSSTSINAGTSTGAVNIGNSGTTLTLLGTTTINATGTQNTTIGNTDVGSTTVTLNAGTTGNIVLGGVISDADATRVLTLNGSGQVRTTSLTGTANEGLQYSAGQYRLGNSVDGDNAITTSRFVRTGAGGTLTYNTGTATQLVLSNNGNVDLSSVGAGATTIGAGTATGTIGIGTGA